MAEGVGTAIWVFALALSNITYPSPSREGERTKDQPTADRAGSLEYIARVSMAQIHDIIIVVVYAVSSSLERIEWVVSGNTLRLSKWWRAS